MKHTKQKAIIFYYDQMERFDYLSMEECGKMITAIINYSKNGEVTEFDDRAMRIIFDEFKKELDIDAEKYEQKCEANRIRGKKGGRPKKNEEESEKPNSSFEDLEKANGFFVSEEKPNGFLDEDKKAEKANIQYTINNTQETKDNTQDTKDNTQDTKDQTPAAETAADMREQAPSVSLFGIYHNIPFSDSEMSDLRREFPTDWKDRLDKVSLWYHNKGIRCINGLREIRKWAAKDRPKGRDMPKSAFIRSETPKYRREYDPDLDLLVI